jgi:hypothetical protein
MDEPEVDAPSHPPQASSLRLPRKEESRLEGVYNPVEQSLADVGSGVGSRRVRRR